MDRRAEGSRVRAGGGNGGGEELGAARQEGLQMVQQGDQGRQWALCCHKPECSVRPAGERGRRSGPEGQRWAQAGEEIQAGRHTGWLPPHQPKGPRRNTGGAREAKGGCSRRGNPNRKSSRRQPPEATSKLRKHPSA